MNEYQLRKEACVLLERERLEKKGTTQALALARHSVNRTLWILYNNVGLSKRQALDVLEARQVEKRTRLRTVYFYELSKYDTQLQYSHQFTDMIILKDTLLNFMVKSTTKKQPYLWLARQARQVGLKPRELIEAIDRLHYKQSCNIKLIDSIETDTSTIDRKARSIQKIDLVGQLERLVKAYQGKTLLIYGNMLFTTMTYQELCNMVYHSYGQPNHTILRSLYNDRVASGQIYYKENIMQAYIERLHTIT